MNKIKDIMRVHEMTIKEFRELIKMSDEAVRGWIKGNIPAPKSVDRIVEAFKESGLTKEIYYDDEKFSHYISRHESFMTSNKGDDVSELSSDDSNAINRIDTIRDKLFITSDDIFEDECEFRRGSLNDWRNGTIVPKECIEHIVNKLSHIDFTIEIFNDDKLLEEWIEIQLEDIRTSKCAINNAGFLNPYTKAYMLGFSSDIFAEKDLSKIKYPRMRGLVKDHQESEKIYNESFMNSIKESSIKKEVFDIDDSSAYPKMDMSPIRIGNEELYGDLFTKFPIKDVTASGNFINKLDKFLSKYKLDKIVDLPFVTIEGFKKTKKKYTLNLVLDHHKKNDAKSNLLLDIIKSLDDIDHGVSDIFRTKINRYKSPNKSYLTISILKVTHIDSIISALLSITSIYDNIINLYKHNKSSVFIKDKSNLKARIELRDLPVYLENNYIYNISPKFINVSKFHLINSVVIIDSKTTNNTNLYIKYRYKHMNFIYVTKYVRKEIELGCSYILSSISDNELKCTYIVKPNKKEKL